MRLRKCSGAMVSDGVWLQGTMAAPSVEKRLVGDDTAEDDASQMRGHGGESSELRTWLILVDEAVDARWKK